MIALGSSWVFSIETTILVSMDLSVPGTPFEARKAMLRPCKIMVWHEFCRFREL
jgi:hypothetical protein